MKTQKGGMPYKIHKVVFPMYLLLGIQDKQQPRSSCLETMVREDIVVKKMDGYLIFQKKGVANERS